VKKILLSLVLVCMLSLAVSWTANAGAPIVPTVTAVEPASAYNDIDTRVTITGADFAVDASGTPPTVTLEGRLLDDVTWVDTQTLTATMPWGMDAGFYALGVVNPDGGTATQTRVFEVKRGIGQWNSGELNGADVRQLLIKPDDPNTLYALAYGVGLFRSDDAGANWHFTSANVIGNADFVLDPHHPDWLYCASFDGLRVSKDKGETWGTMLYDTSGDVTPRSWEVFVSPNTTDTLFLATYGDGTDARYKGLQWSTEGGAPGTWHQVPSMEGTAVQNVAFDPTPGSHDMVLATSDARVFRSKDDGLTWIPATPPPGITSLGLRGYLMYNPYFTEKPGEVWLVSTETTGGMFKSDADLTSWTDVTPWAHSGYMPTFVGPEDVYIWTAHSTDGGTTWTPFGPPPTWGGGDFVFSPDDTHTIYYTDARVGVTKSTTGGVTGPSGEASWTVSNKGLTGMRCVSMSVSTTDPIRVCASFNAWPGVFVSDDGTGHWRFIPIADSFQVWQVLQDPFDAGLVYAFADGGLYKSTDGGETWSGKDWTSLLPPGAPGGLMAFNGSAAADPHQEGHLLVTSRVGQSSVHDHDLGYLYSSDDWGTTWTSIVVTGTAGSIGPIGDIEFDPSLDASGTVYLASDGNGVFKSTDHGGTWNKIDNGIPGMQSAADIAIATHPRHVMGVLAGGLWVSSADGTASWSRVGDLFYNGGIPIHSFRFVDHDSNRMYAATWAGLYFSGDTGVTWTPAAGALGHVQVTTVADTAIDGHTLLYAATTGGDAAAIWNPSVTPPAMESKAATSRAVGAAPATSDLVGAGIYRRAQVPTSKTFYSTGSWDGWILESSHTSSRGGSTSVASTTFRLGDNASRKQYRAVLSFPTSSLPDSAVITGVALKLKKQGVTGGGDPVTRFNGFMVDIKKGHFGSSASLQASDFQASAGKSYGPFKPAAVSNFYSLDLSGAKAYINKLSTNSGLTQVRLRFKLDDDNDRVADYLRLYSGSASTAWRPQLIVTYYLP
jgi:hypothetical protein